MSEQFNYLIKILQQKRTYTWSLTTGISIKMDGVKLVLWNDVGMQVFSTWG